MWCYLEIGLLEGDEGEIQSWGWGPMVELVLLWDTSCGAEWECWVWWLGYISDMWCNSCLTWKSTFKWDFLTAILSQQLEIWKKVLFYPVHMPYIHTAGTTDCLPNTHSVNPWSLSFLLLNVLFKYCPPPQSCITPQGWIPISQGDHCGLTSFDGNWFAS